MGKKTVACDQETCKNGASLTEITGRFFQKDLKHFLFLKTTIETAENSVKGKAVILRTEFYSVLGLFGEC